MKATYSTLMQSKFFNPAFNSAIFDGPVRIYFAQFHESLALKIYFCLQQKFPQIMAQVKELHKKSGKNILVMLYPSSESYDMSFDGKEELLGKDRLEGDSVIGINGPFEDDRLEAVLESIVSEMNTWGPFEMGSQEATI